MADASDQPTQYANHHIPAFLDLPTNDLKNSGVVQTINDGSLLTAQSIRQGHFSLSRPVRILDTPESIGMKLPSKKKGQISVRDIANIVGNNFPVRVIDVKVQHELSGWIFEDLVEYFEDEDRLLADNPTRHQPSSNRSRRKAAQNVYIKRPDVLNQISLEFSQTNLAPQVRSPQFVRDLDWIDTAWPAELRTKKQYPAVQYYCLTSAAGCYTDFHLDFGGTSVWYHVLSGRKEFCLIAPTPDNLKVYEEWLCSSTQHETFFADMIEEKSSVFKISLEPCQTLIIPSAWIHSVYTPEDSLVFGGNFLHGFDVELQLQAYSIEVRSRVMEQYRFPYFIQVHFYAGGMYLRKLRRDAICKQELEGLPKLINALEAWWNVWKLQDHVEKTGPSVVQAARHAAAQNHCSTVEDFLATLRSEHARVRQGVVVANTTKVASSPRAEKTASPFRIKTEPTSPSSEKPRLRLKLGNVKKKGPKEERSPFHITLSSLSSKIVPPPMGVPVVRSQPRESSSVLIDEREALKDDEWIPTPERKRRQSQGVGSLTPPRSSKKPKTTARQRLLKKAGF